MRWAASILALWAAGLSAFAHPATLKGAELLHAHGTSQRLTQSTASDRSTMSENSSPAPIHIRIGPVHGWERVFTISNGLSEVVVIPAIGRVMELRFPGEPSPFWSDPSLHGQLPDARSDEWGNFGGDKTWPAPQSDWPRVTPRAWPPPVAFDSMPVEASIRRDAVVLTSAIDPHYGIQAERAIRLATNAAQMTIVTTYRKLEGAPVRVGVWIITQLKDPVGVYAAFPEPSLFADGYNRQSGDVLPRHLKSERGLLSMTRDPKQASKIGTDGDQLVWVGEHQTLLVESPRIPGAEYPDHGSSAEVYTNPDPKAYVELETLGPLRTLAIGDTLSQTNTYTLGRRTVADPELEARRVLRR